MSGAKFRDLAAALETEIRAMRNGQRVPSEHEIAARFDVARSTARAALQELAVRHVIRRVRGAGSFAVTRIDYPIDAARAPSWSATVRAAGATPRSVVVSCSPTRPPVEVARTLDLDDDRPCHRLVRRSFIDDVAASWGIEWVPLGVIPDLAETLRVSDSLHDVLIRAARTVPRRVWVRAGAEALTPEVAANLDATPSSLGWYVESLNHDQNDGRLLCLTQRWIRADMIRVVFESTLAPTPAGPTG